MTGAERGFARRVVRQGHPGVTFMSHSAARPPGRERARPVASVEERLGEKLPLAVRPFAERLAALVKADRALGGVLSPKCLAGRMGLGATERAAVIEAYEAEFEG